MWGELASLREKEKRDERREAGEREKRMEKMREKQKKCPWDDPSYTFFVSSIEKRRGYLDLFGMTKGEAVRRGVLETAALDSPKRTGLSVAGELDSCVLENELSIPNLSRAKEAPLLAENAK